MHALSDSRLSSHLMAPRASSSCALYRGPIERTNLEGPVVIVPAREPTKQRRNIRSAVQQPPRRTLFFLLPTPDASRGAKEPRRPMAILFDNLPYKACRALPVLGIIACVVLANPSLEIPIPVVLITCVVCTLLNVELSIEHKAKYYKDFVVAQVGTGITIACGVVRGFALVVERDPAGGRYAAMMLYWVIVAIALLGGGVIAMCNGAGLTEDEALRWEGAQNSTSSAAATQLANRDPEQGIGSGLRGTGPPAYLLGREWSSCDANQRLTAADGFRSLTTQAPCR